MDNRWILITGRNLVQDDRVTLERRGALQAAGSASSRSCAASGSSPARGKVRRLLDAAGERGVDDPALNMAIAVGNAGGQPVLAVFGLTADYPAAQRRHYRFLVEGLVDAENDLSLRNVPLIVRLGSPADVVPTLVAELGASFLVGDENPVRIGQQWRNQVAGKLEVPFHVVDADVVVPTALFPKEEFAARTLRPKIHRVWQDYLKPLPRPHAENSWSEIRPAGEVT